MFTTDFNIQITSRLNSLVFEHSQQTKAVIVMSNVTIYPWNTNPNHVLHYTGL